MICTALILLLTSPIPPDPWPLVRLTSEWQGSGCPGYLLPGTHELSPNTFYRIDSDLPEIYSTNGVLYTTRPVLPPFDTHSDGPLSKQMRTQVNTGFSTIDNSFEVFIYHLSVDHQPGETRRIVVHVQNEGERPQRLQPRGVILHGPNRAQSDSVESILAERVLLGQWDEPIDEIVLPPGESAIIAHTLQIGASADGPDASTASFVNGLIRCDTPGVGGPNLVVSVISIPGDVPPNEMKAAADGLLNIGANSAETSMDLRIPPPEGHVRRVVGVSTNSVWRNQAPTIDLGNMPDDDLFFLMAAPRVQTLRCPEARQTVDLILHPPYVHSDTIGNYMMEYYITLYFVNRSTTPRTFDLMFGKDDAPIGLAWQMAIRTEETFPRELAALPVRVDWAGPRRVEGEPWFRKTMFDEGPLTLQPGDSQWVSMRLMIVGTSSLPWHLHVVPVEAPTAAVE